MTDIQQVAIKQIKVGERARSEMGDIKALAKSIDEHGLLQPIGLTRKLELIWGGRRLAAYQHLKMTHIPAVIKDVAGSLDKLEKELLENSERKDMEWTERAALEKEIFEAKKKADPDWSKRKQADVQKIDKTAVQRRIELAEAIERMPELADAKNENAAWKALKRAQEDVVALALAKKARLKDNNAYQAAQNHYVISDVFDGLAGLKNNSFDFVELDPPYAIDIDKAKGRNVSTLEKVDRYTEWDVKTYPKQFERLAEECFRVLRSDRFAVFWYGIDPWHDMVLKVLAKVGFSCQRIPAVWYKGAMGQVASPDTSLGNSYETFIVARKGQPKLRKAGRSNVFHYPPVPPSQKIHSTQKPLELMEEILDTFTYTGASVLVPFLGSGVTMYAACKKTMLAHGFEIDKVQKARFLKWVEDQENAASANAAESSEPSKNSDDDAATSEPSAKRTTAKKPSKNGAARAA